MAMVFATQGLMTVASRIVLAFARDQGFGPLSKSLREVHPTLKVPVWYISFVSAWTVIFGLICQSITARVWMFHQTLIDCRSWILCGAQRDPFRVGRIHADQLHCTQ
jgi:amino acid transporter